MPTNADELKPIRTFISGAYWYVPDKKQYERASLTTMSREPSSEQTYWFDELFEGGIKIPDPGGDSPITILLNGAPGTGKSTLALEMSYRLANPPTPEQKPLRSIYLTTEGHAPWTIEHARQFKWDLDKKVFDVASSAKDLAAEGGSHAVRILPLKSADDLEYFVKEVDSIRTSRPTDEPSVNKPVRQLFPGLAYKPSPVVQPAEPPPHSVGGQGGLSKDILILDNLNAVDTDANKWFQFTKSLSTKGFRVFIIVLDSSHSTEKALAWEYLADIVIHLGRQYPAGYMIRTLEIVKARYQGHVYGRQQMKLVAGSDKFDPRDHPYRTEGGIFIFPSMHLALSRRKMSDRKSVV